MVIPEAARALDRDLQRIFGGRLQSLAIYGQHLHAAHDDDHGHGAHGHHTTPATHTLAIVDAPTVDDLRACAKLVESWHDAGLATPLVIAAGEFEQSLDVFALEFGAILADHVVVSGRAPFDSLTIDPVDIRRACETQARGHLLHLREGFLETRGRGDALSVLIVQSAPALATLVSSIARLDGHAAEDPSSAARHIERTLQVPGGAISGVTALVGVHEIASADAERMFPSYLDAVEKLVAYADRWNNV
jgi:hypothetical protein